MRSICFFSLPATALFFKQKPVKFSGSEVQLYLLAKELAKDRRSNIDFIVENEGQEKVQIVDKVKVWSVSTIPKRFALFPVLRFFEIIANLYSVLDQMNPGVIIQQSAGMHTFILYAYCLIRNKKFCYMIAHDWNIDEPKRGRLNFIEGKLFQLAMSKADLVIGQTDFQRKKFLSVWKKDIPVIPNGHPLYRSSKNGDYILAVGRLVPWKRPELFIDLAMRFPNQHFVYVGSSRNYDKLSQRFMRRSITCNNLTYLPAIEFDKNEELYRHAVALVLVSNAEGLPNIMLQAASAGVPTISLSLDPGHFLTDGGGVVCDDNFEKMVDVLDYCLSHINETHELGLRARSLFIKRYFIKKIGMELKHCLDRLDI